jgi:hypothetical protein
MTQFIIPFQLKFINFTYNNNITLISIDNLYNIIRKRFPEIIILIPLIINNNLIIPIVLFSKYKYVNLSYYEQILFKKQINYISLYLLTYQNNIDLYNYFFLPIFFNI